MKNLRFSSIGLAACIILGGTWLVILGLGGVAPARLQSLPGMLAAAAAARLTPAPSAISAGSARMLLTQQLYLAQYAGSLLAFTTLFWLCTRSERGLPTRLESALLALQCALCVAVEPALLYVLSAELAVLLPWRRALAWLAVAQLSHVAETMRTVIAMRLSDPMARLAALDVGTDLIFSLLAFGVSSLAARERRARAQLAVSHAELLATQSLLSETVRASERLRIARDLHDSVGHHLTALNLHLDLALRQLGETANQALRTSRELSGALLSEVRVVVSAERERSGIDLRSALEALCADIPSPRICVEFEGDVTVASAAAAHALFHAVQEAVSNAVRHARASTVVVSLRRDGQWMAVTIRDDGQGSRGRPPGNGLRGMLERLSQVGGRLHAADHPQGGFEIRLDLPLRTEAAR